MGKTQGKRQIPGGNKEGNVVPPKSTGVLVICKPDFEHVALQEALDVIKSAYEELKDDKLDASNPKQNDTKSGLDIGKLLQAELDDLKDTDNELFKGIKTQVKGNVFVKFRNNYDGPSPFDLVDHLLRQCTEQGAKCLRRCSKLLPVTHCSSAKMSDMETMAKELVDKAFPTGEGVKPLKFSVDLDRRMAGGVDRAKVINAFAHQVACPPHSVDLKNPDKVIIVQVVAGSCMASTVEYSDFERLGKFSIERCRQKGSEKTLGEGRVKRKKVDDDNDDQNECESRKKVAKVEECKSSGDGAHANG